MLARTADFEAKVLTQNSLRKWDAKVIYRNVDITAKPDCTATASEILAESNIDYSIDNIFVQNYNYGIFEDDKWLLDGSFVLADDVATLSEIPAMSDSLSKSTYDWDSSWAITFTFTVDHSHAGFTIIFDQLNNEYATDFQIAYYDSGNNLIDLNIITDNDTAFYTNLLSQDNYRKIVLTITKWNKRDRVAKVTEVYFGIVNEFSKSNGKLISINVNEQFDPKCIEVQGNELRFVINNENNEYNPVSPTSVIPYVEERQEIEVFIGLYVSSTAIEWKNCGFYYLDFIKNNEDKLTAEFFAKGLLWFMDKEDYGKISYDSASYTNAYDELVALMQDFGLSSSQYSIDASLSSYVFKAYLPIYSYKQSILALANRASCVVYEDRDGKVVVKPYTRTPNTYEITKDNMFTVPSITINPFVKAVNISKTAYIPFAARQSASNITVTINGTEDVIVYHSFPINLSEVDLSVTGEISVNSYTHYSNFTILNITASGSVTIDIDAGNLVIATVPKTYLSDIYTKGKTATIENTLLAEFEYLDTPAQHILDEYEYYKEYEVNWRGDPCLEIGDVIASIETQFEDETNLTVVENKLEFNGALKAITKFTCD